MDTGDSVDAQSLDREYSPEEIPLYLEVLTGFIEGLGARGDWDEINDTR